MGRKLLIVLAGTAAVAALAFLVERLIVTDEEAIEQLTEDCREAFLAGDVDRILGHLEPGATGESRRRTGPLDRLVRRTVESYADALARVTITEHEIDVDGDEAKGRWVAIALLKPGQPIPAFRVVAKAEYRRGEEGWRIRRVEVLEP